MLPTTRRVLVLGMNYPPEPTGNAPYTGALARGLLRDGFNVSVVASHPHYPGWRIYEGYGEWSRDEVVDSVPIHRVRHYVPSKPSNMRRLLAELTFGFRLLQTKWGDPEVIVLVSPALISSAIALIKSRVRYRRAPVIVWVQDLYSQGLAETGQGSKIVQRVIKALEKWVLHKADRIVVIHDRFSARVEGEFDLPARKIRVIRNWSHFPLPSAIDRGEIRHRLGWKPEDLVVLHAGNMGVKQGLENIIESARIANRRGSGIRFVFLGDGGQRAHLKLIATGIGNVEFMEPLSDSAFVETMQAADLLLVCEKPGVSEMSVPSKLTSYFATGTPTVAFCDPSGICADEIRQSQAGVIVSSGDHLGLLEAIETIVNDPSLARKLGENGRAYRISVLDERVALDHFSSLVEELIIAS